MQNTSPRAIVSNNMRVQPTSVHREEYLEVTMRVPGLDPNGRVRLARELDWHLTSANASASQCQRYASARHHHYQQGGARKHKVPRKVCCWKSFFFSSFHNVDCADRGARGLAERRARPVKSDLSHGGEERRSVKESETAMDAKN